MICKPVVGIDIRLEYSLTAKCKVPEEVNKMLYIRKGLGPCKTFLKGRKVLPGPKFQALKSI